MPREVALLSTFRSNKAYYDEILNNEQLKTPEDNFEATVLLISGCQDNQLLRDGDFNDLFTSQLLQVWKDDTFQGNYRKSHKGILHRMPPARIPSYFRAGQIDRSFEAQTPFTI